MSNQTLYRRLRWFIFLSLALTLVIALGLLLFFRNRPATIPTQSPLPTPTTPPIPTFTPTQIQTQPLLTDTPEPTTPPTQFDDPTITPTRIIDATPSSLVGTPIPLGSEDISDFTFAVCGDNRGGDEVYTAILRQVENDEAAFLLNTGDLVNNGTEKEFQHFADLMNGFTLPFFPVAGNHDSPDGLLDEYLAYSGAPAEHYAFNYGQAHFVIIDSHHGVLRNSELAWLETDLINNSLPLTMVFLHHPPFDPDGTDHIMRQGNEAFMNLVEIFEVDYVFAGHIHAYVDGFRNNVRYIITGGCGAPLYSAGHPNAFYHYVRVKVQGTNVTTEIIQVEAP